MCQLNYCSIMFRAIAKADGVADAGRSRAHNAAVVATTVSAQKKSRHSALLSWPLPSGIAYGSDCAHGVYIDCCGRVVLTRVPLLDIAINPVEYREAR